MTDNTKGLRAPRPRKRPKTIKSSDSQNCTVLGVSGWAPAAVGVCKFTVILGNSGPLDEREWENRDDLGMISHLGGEWV